MKKLLSIFITIILLASLFIIVPSAAIGSTVLMFDNLIEVGENVTVTVKVTGTNELESINYVLNYDKEKLTFVSCDLKDFTSNNNGNVNVVDDTTLTTYVHKFTFKAKDVAGVANLSVTDCSGSYKVSGDPLPKEDAITGASSSLQIKNKDVVIPANAFLSSLSVGTGNLSPKFNKNTLNYTVSVPYETESLNVYAKAEDSKAKVNLSATKLNVGKNTISITVTAQNGTQKIYKIIATRREKGQEVTSQPEPVIPNNPYETIISGKTYEVVTQIPEASVLKGFTASTAEYNGKQVAVLRDASNQFTVFYLKESGKTEIAPYTYNVELEAFEALKHQTFGESVYIFTEFPEGVTMPDSYYSTYTQIGNYSVKVYMHNSSQMSDFAYTYCFTNGEYGLYRYDSKEGTIQRYPDINLVDAPAVTAPVKDNFAKRWASLTTQSKLLMVAFIIAGLCAVLLIGFLGYKAFNIFFKRDKLDSSDIEKYNFDDVTVIGDDKNLND